MAGFYTAALSKSQALHWPGLSPPSTFVPVRVQLDDYFLLNVNADVRVMDNVELFGRVENLTAADYEDVFSFATPGRSFAIGARARF